MLSVFFDRLAEFAKWTRVTVLFIANYVLRLDVARYTGAVETPLARVSQQIEHCLRILLWKRVEAYLTVPRVVQSRRFVEKSNDVDQMLLFVVHIHGLRRHIARAHLLDVIPLHFGIEDHVDQLKRALVLVYERTFSFLFTN